MNFIEAFKSNLDEVSSIYTKPMENSEEWLNYIMLSIMKIK
ncbi:MAG: hypothetical protein ACTSUL_02280 [Promethearchaeota archaeon]